MPEERENSISNGRMEPFSIYLPTVEYIPDTKLYLKRWVILGIFVAYTIAAGVQWMQYSIITNIVMRYYEVEAYQVEWTTQLHMLMYVLCIVPALWIIEKGGNRITMLTAGAGICIGIWIKLLAVRPQGFTFVLIGQAIEAAAQVLTFGLAGSVTAAWFGANEIAFSSSLALFGDQLGAGLGFVLPPLFVPNSDDIHEIERGLRNFCICVAAFSTVVFFIMLIFFKNEPRVPPSKAQIARNTVKNERNALEQFYKMLQIRSFLLMLLIYGIHIGVFNAMGTLLNQVFGSYFQRREKDAGLIGGLIILCGLIGSIIFGIFLDCTHSFKQTAVTLFLGSTVCMIGYTVSLNAKILLLVYVFACLLGLFMFGYYSVGLQLAIELVHPYSEGMACALMLGSVQSIGLVLTPLYRIIFEHLGPLKANLSLIVLLCIGTCLSTLISTDYRRRQAELENKNGTPIWATPLTPSTQNE